MANLLDYIAWRGDLTFAQSEFNEVDNLILSMVSYIELTDVMPPEKSDERITIREASEKLFGLHDIDTLTIGVMFSHDIFEMFRQMGQSRRYAEAELSHYINHVDQVSEKQFSAITVHLHDGTAYVAYRGTDDTIVGWKEDFNMSFQTPVPSQMEAVAYLKWIMTKTRGNLRLGGHSKGGNLAVFAAAFGGVRARRRVTEIYNNDGPGFTRVVIAKEEYKEIKDKIHTFVPQSSIIGMLLEHEEEYRVVHSAKKGIMQHDPLSWQVLGTKFEYEEMLTKESRVFDASLKECIMQMDDKQKEAFVDGLFHIVTQEEYTKLSELSAKSLTGLVKSFGTMDEETRKILLTTISCFIKMIQKNTAEEIKTHKNKS